MGGGSELLSAISALPPAIGRNTKTIGMEVEVFYKNKGWCRGVVANMPVDSTEEKGGEFEVGPEDPYRCLNNVVGHEKDNCHLLCIECNKSKR